MVLPHSRRSSTFEAWVRKSFFLKLRARFSGRQIWSAVARHRFGFASEFRRHTARENGRIADLTRFPD